MFGSAEHSFGEGSRVKLGQVAPLIGHLFVEQKCLPPFQHGANNRYYSH